MRDLGPVGQLGMVTLENLGLMLNPLTRELLPMKLMLASLAPSTADYDARQCGG